MFCFSYILCFVSSDLCWICREESSLWHDFPHRKWTLPDQIGRICASSTHLCYKSVLEGWQLGKHRILNFGINVFLIHSGANSLNRMMWTLDFINVFNNNWHLINHWKQLQSRHKFQVRNPCLFGLLFDTDGYLSFEHQCVK